MWIMTLCLMVLMAVVFYLDITKYLIPNWLVGIILALYPVYLFTSPVPIAWPIDLAIMAGVFVLGFIVFHFNIMGGGDIKLLTVLALWSGAAGAAPFFLYTAILGGLLSLAIIIGRPLAGLFYTRVRKNEQALPRVLTPGEALPYGLAISVAFVIVLQMGRIKGLPPLIDLQLLP